MKYNMILTLMLTVSSAIYAQKNDPSVFAERQALKMKEQLTLSPEQYASVKQINEKYAHQFQDMRKAEDSGDRSTFKQLREKKHEEIDRVLTPEQRTKWKEIKKDKKREHAKHVKHRKQSRKEFKASLSLSNQQESALENSFTKFRKERHTIIADKALSDAERKPKLQALRDSREAEVKTILTEDQYKKWKAFTEDKGKHRNRRGHR